MLNRQALAATFSDWEEDPQGEIYAIPAWNQKFSRCKNGFLSTISPYEMLWIEHQFLEIFSSGVSP